VCKPKDFAGQINLEMSHCWGVVRAIVDMVLKMDEGKYLLVKDPNKELLRLYSIPEDAFESNYAEEPLPEILEVPTTLPAARAAEEGADD
jgi:translation initiation factor 3 subunit D